MRPPYALTTAVSCLAAASIAVYRFGRRIEMPIIKAVVVGTIAAQFWMAVSGFLNHGLK